ncbi:hypothetical protein FRC10_010143 [Ceratobasidium sp. 414]|nr:hypothetical protein FRC10_010143 [Ceratobasidium sp. 414]
MEEFRSDLWVLDQGQGVRKLDVKVQVFKFMGFRDNSRAYHYWSPDIRQVLQPRNVVFAAGVRQEQIGEDEDEDEDDLHVGGGAGPQLPVSSVQPVKMECPLMPPANRKTKEPARPPPPKAQKVIQPAPPKKCSPFLCFFLFHGSVA